MINTSKDKDVDCETAILLEERNEKHAACNLPRRSEMAAKILESKLGKM